MEGGNERSRSASPSRRRERPLPRLNMNERLEERAHAARAMRHLYSAKSSYAFGSLTDRSHMITGATPDNYGSLWAPKEAMPETTYSPNVHSVGLMQDPRSPSPTRTWQNWGASSIFVSNSPRLKQPPRPPYREDIGPDTYNVAEAKDALSKAFPTIDRSKFNSQGTFNSTAKRFLIPAVIKKEEVETTWTMEKDAVVWRERKFTLPHEKRFVRSPMSPPKKSYRTPGFVYDTDTYVTPSIDKEVKTSSITCSSAFKSSRSRFPEAKFPYTRPLGPDTYSGAWFRAQSAWVRQYPTHV